MSLLEVKHLKKVYTTRFGGAKVEALADVEFSVEEGEYVAIMGESGSGKTTLLNILAALDKPTGGKVLLNGRDMAAVPDSRMAAYRRDNLGFVFQDFNLLDTFSLRDNIFLPLVLARKEYGEMEERLKPLADRLEIKELLDKFPYEVSGGQKQRTAVARALMNHPDLILADEPTGNLDSRSGAAVIGAFREAKEKLDATIFMVTHDSFSASHCDRVLLMRDGQVQKELKRQGSRREFMDILLDELKQLNERM